MPEKAIQHLHISVRTMVWFLAVLAAAWVLWVVRDVAVALLFAVVIASAMEPAIRWLAERKVPRILGVILLYLVIAAVFFFVIYLVFPVLIDELRAISATYPELRREAISRFQDVSTLPFTELLRQSVEDVLRAPSEYIARFSGNIIEIASALFGGITAFILVIIFSFYLTMQERGIENFLRLVTPVDHEPYVIDLWTRSQAKLGRWARGQLLLAAIVGVIIFFGLTLLGVENALLFALLAAVFEVIPVAGPILAAVPAVVTAFLVSVPLGVGVIILYVVVQQVESHVIVPVVMQKAVGLSPLIVVLALLVGVKLAGIAGLLLSVPVATVLVELLNDWDKKKRSFLAA